MSDNMPDFDNMSQEEIMAWMETLAKRQGASEGFTTSADMDIAEIDPSTVVIDEPGYVPYGQEASQPVEPVSKPTVAPPAPQPVKPAAQVPPAPVSEPIPAAPPTPVPPGVGVTGALAWLESLAADQGEQIFNLDLSDTPAPPVAKAPAAPVAPPAPASPAAPVVDPMAWLEDLARSQVAEPSLESLERLGADDDEEESEKLDPFAEGVNPMEWLETLAKRQGAKDEELTTNAHMNIPAPVEAEVEQVDYQPFSFDTPPTRRSAEPAALENPAEWLTSLAGAEGYSEEGVLATQQPDTAPEADLSLDTIQDAIAGGTVTREQMQYFLDQQADQLAEQPEDLLDVSESVVEDEDTPIQPAELPDWLSELRPEQPGSAQAAPTKPIDALFDTPPAADMPDWLREDVLGDQEADLDSIFEPELTDDTEKVQPVVVEQASVASTVEVDPNDPWTEAFDAEYEQGGEPDISAVPEWYQQNVTDPARIAAVEGQIEAPESAEAPAAQLVDAALPEEKDLAAAQPQSVPVWMTGFEEAAAPAAEEEAPVFADMPDWLKEVEASVSPDDVPEWLVETISTEEVVEISVEPVMVQQPVTPTPPPPAPKPAPARVLAGEAAVVLQQARDKEQGGDLDGALADYESMIRSSLELEAVVAELTDLVKSYRTTPAVYRVLGDGLMRQGKLQAALNTYREALNQL